MRVVFLPILTSLWALIPLATTQHPAFLLDPALAPEPSVTFSGNETAMPRAACIALSHGGGPLPLLGDPDHAALVDSLRTRVPALLGLGTPRAPRAIVLVTAHWSEPVPTISCAEKHPMLYDYNGFPPASYKLRYDAPGSPTVAGEVERSLRLEGFEPKMDAERGE